MMPPTERSLELPDRVSRKSDLRYRLAYSKAELARILPFGVTTLDEMIKKGLFPDGSRTHPGARRIWPRRIIEEWLARVQTQKQVTG